MKAEESATQSASDEVGHTDHPAADFTLPSLNSHPASAVHLASLKGKAIVLN